MNRTELAKQAKKLSGDIDGSRWALAKLASTARNCGIGDYAAIIGTACRRSESTVSHWARTFNWTLTLGNDWVGTRNLPYSFFESCARYSDRIETAELCEKLMNYHDSPGATLESFRAELAVMAGAGGDVAEISKGLSKARNKILGWVDRMPTKRGGDCLTVAADALADALGEMEGERVTA